MNDEHLKNIFISWSEEGSISEDVAKMLYGWLPKVIDGVKPFLSSRSIAKGTQWFYELTIQLAQIRFGLICITRANMTAPWMMFEAGALAKGLGSECVSPLAIDLPRLDIIGPLAHYNATELLSIDDMWALVSSINTMFESKQTPPDVLEERYEVFWPRLEKDVRARLALPHDAPKSQRSDRAVLDDILERIRVLPQAATRDDLVPLLSQIRDQLTGIEKRSVSDSEIRSRLDVQHEVWERRFELVKPSSVDRLMAALWWVAERGNEVDLPLLDDVLANKAFEGTEVPVMAALAKRMIQERVAN